LGGWLGWLPIFGMRKKGGDRRDFNESGNHFARPRQRPTCYVKSMTTN
jgi:hypothetical protein